MEIAGISARISISIISPEINTSLQTILIVKAG